MGWAPRKGTETGNFVMMMSSHLGAGRVGQETGCLVPGRVAVWLQANLCLDEPFAPVDM